MTRQGPNDAKRDGNTPRLARSLSDSRPSWTREAENAARDGASPRIGAVADSNALPHMAALLRTGGTPVWPTRTWQPPSSSSSYTTSDESSQMELEGDYMLRHPQTMHTRLRTPRARFANTANMATSSAVASYERSLHHAAMYGCDSSSDSGSSSPVFGSLQGDDNSVKALAVDSRSPNVPFPMQNDVDMGEDLQGPQSDEGLPALPTVGKTSRYLREIDRRVILSRIDSGEKQSVLAKEYQVSRAAICNLNKHRDEVFARKDANPLAKHPKKPRPKTPKPTVVGMPATMKWSRAGGGKYCFIVGASGGSSLERNQFGVHEIKSRAAALLLTTLRRKFTASDGFRRASGRLMNLLMEEALALVPIRRVDVVLQDQSKEVGVAMEHPPCAVSMEQEGCPMLELFHRIEPEQPTGYICFNSEAKSVQTDSSTSESDTPAVSLFDTHLPPSLNYHNVFLLEHVASPGPRLCAAVRCLQERGASKSMLYVVSLIASLRAVNELRAQYPDVKVITAQLVPDEEEGDESKENADTGNTSPTSLMRLRFEQVYQGTSF